MAGKGFFKTLKSFSYAAAVGAAMMAAALFAGAALASCDNLGDGYDAPSIVAGGQNGGPNNGGTVTAPGAQTAGGQAAQVGECLTAYVSLPSLPTLSGNAPLSENVARYAGLSNDSAQSTDDVSKSAFPNIADAADTAYSFEAELAIEGGATYTADGSYNGTTGKCSFSFAGAKSAEERTYTLTVSLYHTSGTPATKSLVASASQSVTVGAGEASFAASVQLAPNLESAPNGSLSLPIKFSDTSVSSVKLMLLNSAGTDVTTTYLDGLSGTTLNLTSGEGTIASKDGGLPAGTYTLLMTFMKGTAQVGARTESLNIYPTMQTKLWWTKDGMAESATTALTVTQFDQKEFWVRGTGGVFYTTVFPTAAEAEDTNNGSFAFPLKTIQAAVDRIKAAGDTTTQYTVYIDGKVTVPADADYSTISDDYKKSLAYIDSAQKIAITGWTGSGFDIIDCGKKCRAITAASGAEVAITKLAIKNGDGVNYGGALYVGGGDSSVVLDDGVLVNGNHCETNGGAIYCNGNLYICGSAVVGDYSPSMTAALEDDCGNLCDGSGGGVSCSGNLYLGYSGKNSSGGLIEKALSGGIYRNYSKTYGGGIYSTGTVTMASGSVDFNAATNGGGVYVSGSSTSSGKFYMGGTSRISGNEATGAGGGVYNSEYGIFCMAGSAIVGVDPSGLTEAAKEDNGKHSNMAKYGGGILIGKPSGFKFGYKNETTSDPTFSGGVYYNYSTDDGGGIRVDCPTGTGQIFNFERGSVCYNSSGLVGGGITVLSVTSNPKIYITGGQVSNNSAGTDGGGIHAQNVYVGGGKIAGNSAAKYGGGVYASQEFYLYGTGVIGDPSKAQIAQANDCSNKAKAGGGVYSHKVYIGYSDASTPAACTGGIYRNYATAVKGSETYFYGGGGICIRGTSADWLFKMQSGTVAYNAGDSSDGYGGGLFIYGSGAPDSSITYPEATGGSFVGNGAKYGGAVCCYSRTLGLGGSIYMPSATGENGDNDIYLKEGILRLLSNFDSATPTPVVTITPYEYTLNTTVLTGSALSAAECAKFAVTQPAGVEFPWTIEYDSTNGGVLKHDRNVFYVADYGDNTSGDGTKDNPYETIKFALTKFTDKMPASVDFKNKIYVLTNMTYDAGLGSNVPCYYEIVGCKGGTLGNNVTFTFNTPDDSGLYVAYGQKIKLTHIDITQSSATANNYAAILVENSSTNGVGELWMEDCSIKNMYANACSAIAAKGDVHLKNVEISGNKTVANTSGATPFGPAINSTTGTVSVLGKVVIKDNQMQINTAAAGDPPSYVYKDQNLWIGENTGTAVFHPIGIAGILDGESDIGVTLFDYGTLYTTFTSGFASAGISDPATVFASDDGMSVVKSSNEATMSPPTTLYVRLGGSDLVGNGSSLLPFATIQTALDKINGLNNASAGYTIKVEGVLAAAQHAAADETLKAASLTIKGDSAATSVVSGGLSESSEPILWLSEVTVPVTIENIGFISGKNSDSTSGGGAILAESCDNITIKDSAFTSCSTTIASGGAIYLNGGTLTLSNTSFTGNSSGYNGGAIFVKTGTLEMNSGTIAANTATGSGGGVSVGTGGTFIMSGGTISGNSAGLNGGGINNSGIACIYDDAVIGDSSASGTATSETDSSNKAYYNGGGICNLGKLALGYKAWASTATAPAASDKEALTKGVYYNYAKAGGGIFNANSSTVYIASGNISKNMAASTSGNDGGGGINSYGASARLYMTGGTVSQNNSAHFGGGVLVYSGAAELTGVTISGNTANSNGGGFACVGGTVTMNSGTIGGLGAGNSAAGGAGVYLKQDAAAGTPVFTMKGGEVSYNTVASGGSGGGFMNQYGTLNIQGAAEISNNDGGSNGGGILTFGTTKMTGGTISANTAHNGGGVFVFQNDFAMSDGTISGNTATVNPSAADPSETGHGGGVYVNNLADGATIYLGDFKLSGAAYIPLGTGNDVYLQNSITIEGDLTHAAPAATITPSVYSSGTIVLTEASAGLVAGNYDKFAVTPQTVGAVTKNWTVNSLGYLAELTTGGGSVTIHTPEGDLNLAASATTITTSADDTTVTVSATDASGSAITSGFTWNGVTVYYGADEIDSGTGNTYKFKKTFPKGTYRLTVSVTYKGTTYSDTFTITKTVDGAVAVAMPADFKKITAGSFKRKESSTSATAYTVTLTKDFYMCDHEVTQKEWFDLMGKTQADLISAVSGGVDKGTGDDYPVYYVNWYQAIAYCNKKSAAEGLTPCYTVSGVSDSDWGTLAFTRIPTSRDSAWDAATFNSSADGYRLPTEAEWVYAALGDYKDDPNWNGYGDSSNSTVKVFAGYNGSNSIGDYAWHSGNAGSQTHETKTTPNANSYDLYDMSGNVFEWCWDWTGNYDSADVTDPIGASGSYRIKRGGSWASSAVGCSVTNRDNSDPSGRNNGIGFRVVRNAP